MLTSIECGGILCLKMTILALVMQTLFSSHVCTHDKSKTWHDLS